MRKESLRLLYSSNTFSIGVEEKFDVDFGIDSDDDDDDDDYYANMGMGNCLVEDYTLRLTARAKCWLRAIGNLNIRDMTSVVFHDAENFGGSDVRLDIPFSKALRASVSLDPNEQHEASNVFETIYHVSRKKEEERMTEALVVLLEETEDGRLSMGVIEEFVANLRGCGGF